MPSLTPRLDSLEVPNSPGSPRLATASQSGAVTNQSASSGEGDIGTIANWASPGSKKYYWSRTGNNVIFSWYISSSGGSASTNTSVFYFDFPAGVPTPRSFSNQLDVSSAFLAAGSCVILANNNTGTNSETDAQAALAYNGGTLKIYTRCAASAKNAWIGTIHYTAQ